MEDVTLCRKPMTRQRKPMTRQSNYENVVHAGPPKNETEVTG